MFFSPSKLAITLSFCFDKEERSKKTFKMRLFSSALLFLAAFHSCLLALCDARTAPQLGLVADSVAAEQPLVSC